MNPPGLVLWFCGLPGSGKTTVSRIVQRSLEEKNGIRFAYVAMDDIRKKLFPEQSYDDAQRDASFRSFVLIAKYLSESGVNVILDGTGHKLAYRNLARAECQNFAEVYLKCPMQLCIERETSRMGDGKVRQKLYEQAIERRETGRQFEGLGKVPGIDEPFEESPNPEIVVDASEINPEKASGFVIEKLQTLRPELFQKQ